MPEPFSPPKGWLAKFAHAFRGVKVGVSTERSFLVHLPAAIAVFVLAAWLQLDAIRHAILVVCVFSVWGAELFNASLERLAKAVDKKENPLLKDALDMAGGAVLLVSLGAVLVGAMVFLPPLLDLLRG